ncbi:arabinose efflux permease family protein [Saccharomonospora xinjiangensis XJ-54]|uniref:Arabinose efflux permease family protein n=2 Tax=Saccharomonospora TaxID=1851 RepID=I0V815_9PSEU|nr:arabinose efflux permease family protein [Saccharomonospora xinjiangensis XJ-54]
MFPRGPGGSLEDMVRIEETSRRSSATAGWLGVVTVAFATFTVVTSEMLPVGLLTPIGAALRVSEGTAGLTLTITGLVAAVSAPLLTAVLGRFDRRAALAALMTVLAAGNALAAVAPNFAVMVLARVLVGLGMGGVWAIAAGISVRLVPARSVGTATSLVFSGIAVASVLGVPAGTYLGELAGWRAAFLVFAGLALALAVTLLLVLPPLPAEQPVGLGGVLSLLGNPVLRTGLIVMALIVTAHFAAYTYVRPALEEIAGVGPGLIGTLLLVYGVAGVLGNFAAGAGAARSPRTTLVVISIGLAVTLPLLALVGTSTLTAGVVLVVWGVAYGGVSVGTQTWVLASVPDAREAASSLFVGGFNAVIALGAFAGGRIVDVAGVSTALYTGGALAVIAVAVLALGKAPSGSR